MKSIAFVFDGLGFGGIERIGTDYVNMCVRQGYKVDVYNLTPGANEMANNLPECVNYYPVNYRREYCPELYSYGVQKWWWGKYAYAVISPFLSAGQMIYKLFSPKRKYDVAIAISGHINDLSFVAKDFIQADTKICWCHGTLINYLAMFDAYSILYKKVDKIITLSSFGEKDTYAGRKYLYDKYIQKIYNPTYISAKKIDMDKVEQLRSQYGDFALMVARTTHVKSQNIAVSAMKKLQDMNLKKHIVFVGDGYMLEEFKAFAEKEGISEFCHFVGSQSDVHNYIAASYVNVLTSKWEGLPTVIVEAMTLGKPCVMTNSDDGEVSGSGRYCIVTDVDDVDAVAEGLYRLYTDEAEYKKYCALSLERAKAFDPETIKNQFFQMLEA